MTHDGVTLVSLMLGEIPKVCSCTVSALLGVEKEKEQGEEQEEQESE